MTTWPRERQPSVLLKSLESSPRERSLLADARDRKAPIWMEFDLVGDRDSLRWFEPAIEPWEAFERPDVRWSDVADVLGLLGVSTPDGSSGDPRSEALRVLPLVFTLGVRRARGELRIAGDSVCLFPLVGFQRPGSGRLRAWMTRVNLAVVDNLVFTLRLPDRRWPHDTESVEATPSPTLVVRERFVPCAGQPTANELAEAIALYQAATCGAIIGRSRTWLSEIERRFMTGADTSLEGTALGESFHELFRLGVRAEELQRELARLVARFDGGHGGPLADRLKSPFAEELQSVRSFQLDLRQSADGIASMVSSRQLALAEGHRRIAEAQQAAAEAQQAATESFHRRATIVGAAVLIPALVAGVFGANVDLPGKDHARGLAAMLFFMAALGAGTWWGIASLDAPGARLTAFPWRSKFAHVHAGFFIALIGLVFGVITLTPAVDEAAFTGSQAALAITGVAAIAVGLAVSVWCWLNGSSRSEWWSRDLLATRATLAGRLLGPALVLAGAIFGVPALV